MNERQTALDKQIEQWVFVGPLLMVGAFLVLLLTPIRPMALMFGAIAGLPICWKWRFKGAAIATSIFAAILIYQFALISTPQFFWNIAFASTLTLTLWITAFCSQEVESLFSNLQDGAEPATSKFQALKNELAVLTKRKVDDQKINEAAITNLKAQINAKDKQLQTQIETISEDKKLLNEVQTQNLSLQQNLSDTTLENASLKKYSHELAEKLLRSQAECESLLEKTVTSADYQSKLTALESLRQKDKSDAEASHSLLKQKIADNENLLQIKIQELLESAKGLNRAEEQNAGLLQEIFQRRHECTLLKQHSEELSDTMQIKLEEAVSAAEKRSFKLNLEVEAKQSTIEEQAARLNKLEEDLQLNEKELSECRQKADELMKIYEQKELLLVEQLEKAQNIVPDRQLRKQEGLHKQLKEQFNEKSNLLDSTRQDLFVANEELAKIKRELAEKEFDVKQAEYTASLENQLQKTTEELAFVEKQHHDEIEILQALIQSLSAEEINESPKKIENNSKKVDKKGANPKNSEALQKATVATKGRTPKKTKTTNWANAILSRCSDSSP